MCRLNMKFMAMEDVVMMEVDSEEDLDHSKSTIKAKNSDTTRGKLKQLNNEGSRKIVRSKRLTKKPRTKLIIILDTNIIISHLTGLKSFLSSHQQMDSFTILIPLVVLQELDGLKKKCQMYQNYFKFINEQLRGNSSVVSDKTWLKNVPHDARVKAAAKIDLDEINNDDRILKTTLLIKEVTDQPEDTIILVTDDLNLRNKALATGVRVMEWRLFCERFGIEYLPQSTPTATNKNTPDVNIPATSTVETRSSPSSDDTDSLSEWLKVKYSAEKKLSSFIESVLKSVYDSLWDKIFKIDLKNASLYDLIGVIRQGWIGTFSDSFDRDKSTLQSIEMIYELLRTEEDTVKLKSLVSGLVKKIDKPQVNVIQPPRSTGIPMNKKRKVIS